MPLEDTMLGFAAVSGATVDDDAGLTQALKVFFPASADCNGCTVFAAHGWPFPMALNLSMSTSLMCTGR